MAAFLVDTNVISELMRREPDPAVVQWASEQTDFRLSVITVDEIQCGLEHQRLARKAEWFGRFLGTCCTVLPVTHQIADIAGKRRGGFRRRGIVRSQADMLIAATASVHALAVVTRNTGDFEDCGVPVLNPFAA